MHFKGSPVKCLIMLSLSKVGVFIFGRKKTSACADA